MRLIAEAMTSTRGGRSLFSDLSFSVEGGEALVLMGPNGAGKTTLIRIVAGLLAPSAGAVRLDGGDAERSVGEQCHYVGHLNALKAGLTVEENAGFWCRFLDQGGAADRVEPLVVAYETAARALGELRRDLHS